jgi:hypothetical protein
MGIGMSVIWTPMTTAVLNSVESDKSGVASAVNGAIREIGTAFGIALLGTVMNRTYQNVYDKDSSIRALREDPNASPFRPVVDAIGDGNNMAGHVIEKLADFDFVPAEIKAPIIQASSKAFVDGMDVAVYIGAAFLIGASIVNYFLVKDSVVESQAPDPAAAPNEALAPVPSD